jgi:hypothetical protein
MSPPKKIMMLQVDDPRDPESGLAFSVHKSLAWHGTYVVRSALSTEYCTEVVLRSHQLCAHRAGTGTPPQDVLRIGRRRQQRAITTACTRSEL